MENQETKTKKVTQNRTTAKKVNNSTPAQTDDINSEAEAKDATVVILPSTSKDKIVLTDDLLISVKNVMPGSLVYVNTSGVTYEWEKRNAVLELSLGELREMKNHKPKFFNNGWIAIDGVGAGQDSTVTSKEICNALGLNRFYEDSVTFFDINKFLSLDIAVIEKKVKTMPVQARENIIVSIIEEIRADRIDSRVKIRALQDIFGCKFEIDEDE